ncbi:IS630 family transposase [Corallococcus sp. AS-1-12]|uniref:IS630 family transposase n=1 Tax=Corallococcus sp. AS-1-12 TaxID=2874598 RepID=UPI001CBCCDF6
MPSLDAQYVQRMEDVLALYEKPFSRREPVICFDERPVQLLDSKRDMLPMHSGAIARRDFEYVRCGTTNLFCAVEPRTGRHFVKATRCRKAFAEAVRDLARRYPNARKIHLVLDNLNIHTRFSLTRRFGWKEGLRLWSRFCVHYTPVHGSWLNQAEIEVSLVSRQCLGHQRVASVETLRDRTRAWERDANRHRVPIRWAFTTAEARHIFHYHPEDFIRDED